MTNKMRSLQIKVITNISQPKFHIRMTGNTFKERFSNHWKSFSKIEVRKLFLNTCGICRKVNASFQSIVVHPRTGSLQFQRWKDLQSLLAGKTLYIERRQDKLVKKKVFSKFVYQKRLLARKSKRRSAQDQSQWKSIMNRIIAIK